MLKIGEFSKLMKVSVRMLRYYDENDLLKPAFVDEQSGYRMYGNKEVEKLSRIIFMRDLGFSIEEIKVLINTEDTELLKAHFNAKEKEIAKQIALEEKKLVMLKKAQNDYQNGQMPLSQQVIIKEVSDYWVLSVRRKVKDYYAEEKLWKVLSSLIEAQNIKASLSEISFSLYHDGEYKESDVDIEVCNVIEKPVATLGDLVCRKVEGCSEMATLMVYGPFENIASSYQSFVKWLTNHEGYEIIGCDRQIVHRGPWNESDESQYLVEIQIPIKLSC